MKESKKKPGRKSMSPFATAALKAIRQARREAERENARYGLPMVVWQNGRVALLPSRNIN